MTDLFLCATLWLPFLVSCFNQKSRTNYNLFVYIHFQWESKDTETLTFESSLIYIEQKRNKHQHQELHQLMQQLDTLYTSMCPHMFSGSLEKKTESTPQMFSQSTMGTQTDEEHKDVTHLKQQLPVYNLKTKVLFVILSLFTFLNVFFFLSFHSL